MPANLEGYPIKLAYLYGSSAAGRPTPLSDVDIALVLGNGDLTPIQQLKMELRIETRLAERCDVPNADVRVVDDAPLRLRGQVATQGILLYSTDEALRIAFETGTRDEYFDYMPIAAEQRAIYFATLRGREESVVNVEKVEGMIRSLRRYRDHLLKLVELRLEEFLADPMKTGGAKYYLQVSIECCLDICNHIISAEQFRAPQDYRDTFKVLNEEGVFPDDFTQTLQDMVGLRNRLVHLYWEVDDAMIHSMIRHELDDFETFVAYILDFLAKQEEV